MITEVEVRDPTEGGTTPVGTKRSERWLEEVELAWCAVMLFIALCATVLLVGVLLDL